MEAELVATAVRSQAGSVLSSLKKEERKATITLITEI